MRIEFNCQRNQSCDLMQQAAENKPAVIQLAFFGEAVLPALRLDSIVFQSSLKHSFSVHVRDNCTVEVVVEADDVHNDLFCPDPVVELAQPDVCGGLSGTHAELK